MQTFKRWCICLLIIFSQPAIADMGIALGIILTYDFQVGFTVKLLSSDKTDEYVVAAGTSFYPFSEEKLGIDLGFGKTAGLNTFWLYGVDIYQETSYMSAGFYRSAFNGSDNQ